MFDIVLIYYLLVGWLKSLVVYAKNKRAIVSAVLSQLGTASYTAAFVYAIEKGLDFNVLKLFAIGIIVIVIAQKLNR